MYDNFSDSYAFPVSMSSSSKISVRKKTRIVEIESQVLIFSSNLQFDLICLVP